MSRLALITVLVLATLAGQAQTPQQWRDSLARLNQMIDAQPRSTDLRLRKAAVNIELGQWEYAAEEYGRVLAIDDRSVAALYFRAYAYVHLRQYAAAAADYGRVLLIVPRHMEARLGLATVHDLMGRRRDAADEYNLLVEFFPDSAVCYAARAAFETSHKQYDLAAYDWAEAVRLAPDNLDYRASLADVRRRQKGKPTVK